MNSLIVKIFFCLFFACRVFAVTVETLDEQIESQNLTVLRLRIINDSKKELYNTKVKYFVRENTDRPVVDLYDLGDSKISLDSMDENVWIVSITIDTLPPGIFPYESGLCVGIHNRNWKSRNKNLDPSYIASSVFVINDRVELNVNGNHLLDADPLTLVSGTKMLVGNDDSIPFAWHRVPNAEKYKLTIYSSDSQQIYQKEIYGFSESVALESGNYLWKVEAKNSLTDYNVDGNGSLNVLSVLDFIGADFLEQKYHSIESVTGHKDTPMLVVGWGEYADLREWDRPHLGKSFLDENESNSCWAIAIKNLNKFYGGNLSLDEIRWYVTKNKAAFDDIDAWGFGKTAAGDYADIKRGLIYALDSTETYVKIDNKKNPLTYDGIKNYLNSNQEIYISVCLNTKICHAMLIDAFYTTTKGNFVRCVNIDNRGSYGRFFADSLIKTITWYMLIKSPKSVRNMNPLLGVEKFDKFNTWIEWTDTDGDGITDFDEVYRFGTNPELVDSDTDGVNDKDEIYSYTILEKSEVDLNKTYVGKMVDLSKMEFIAGIKDEYMADVDGDGLRAELDSDSDGDGLLDGADPEPYDFNSFVETLKMNELPRDVVLYAQKKLSVNDGTVCVNKLKDSDYCIFASEGSESDYGMVMGARVSAAILYAKNKVFIRSNPDNTFLVDYYGSGNLTSVRPDGRVTIEKNFRADDWPWKLNIVLPSFDEGDSVLVVNRGDSCFLNNDDHFKQLKVESGGIVYFPKGSVYVGDLQLDAEGEIRFEDQMYNTILYVKGKLLWKSNFVYEEKYGFKHESVARNFKFIYSGSDEVFFDTNWHGTIIAPNAKIVLGQTHNKFLYGQFFADEIVVHQFSNIVYVPFDFNQQQEYALNWK